MSANGSVHDRKARGQSLVEFAVFIPVLLVILLTAVDVGRVYLGWVSLSNVARIGANFAAMNPDAWSGSGDATVQGRYRTLMGKDARGIDCTLPATLPAPNFPDSAPNKYSLGARVRVDLQCSFALVTPFLSNLIGDGAGNMNVTVSTTFTIRSGSIDGIVVGGNAPPPSQSPTPTPAQATPTPSPTPTPTPVPTPTVPGSTPGPTPTPTPTPAAPVLSFYGVTTTTDAYGGGPPGSVGENQIVGTPPLVITFHNTTTGTQGNCTWTFGDGNTSNSCGNQVTHTYNTRATYNVTLVVDGYSLTRSSYVLVGCQVPAFAGVRKNSAATNWANAGFTGAITFQAGSGNYKIGYQSLVGGLVNPAGGCSGASILVGP